MPGKFSFLGNLPGKFLLWTQEPGRLSSMGRKAATKHRFGDADMRLVVAKGKRAWGKDELGVWG